MICIFDLEGNGLKEDCSKLWCWVAKDIETGGTYEGSIKNGLDIQSWLNIVFNAGNIVVGHNIIDYDFTVIKRLYNRQPPRRFLDTYVMSRLLNPDRPPPKGFKPMQRHSLEAWGARLGIEKVGQEQWDEWDDNMLVRCKIDVEINHKALLTMLKEAEANSVEELV